MNFLFGLQNIALNIKDNIFLFAGHQLVWGFAIGFGVSTIIHLLIITDNPKHLAGIITKDAANAYETVAKQDQSGTYVQSYTEYQEQYSRIKTLFYIAILVFVIVIGIALLRIWG